MTAIQIFNFDNNEVRMEMVDDVPYFCGKDVAEALGFNNSRDALSRHCTRGRVSLRLNYRGNYFTMIPESDVYRLVMRSNLESAERFQDWVCEEVLPSIRQTGSYQQQSNLTQIQMLAAMANSMVEVEQRQLEQQSAIEGLQHRMNSRANRVGYILVTDAKRRHSPVLSTATVKLLIELKEVPTELQWLTTSGYESQVQTVDEQAYISAVEEFYSEITPFNEGSRWYTHPALENKKFQA